MAPSKVCVCVRELQCGGERHLPNRCYMCGTDEEFTNQLLLHCGVACDVWSMGFCLCRVQWVSSASIQQAFQAWRFFYSRGRKSLIWNLFPLAVLWCISKERNNRAFNNIERTVNIIKQSGLNSFYECLEGGTFVML